MRQMLEDAAKAAEINAKWDDEFGLWEKPHIGIQCEGWDADPYAATRLAITRAAASIGEKMRQEDALRSLSKLSDEMGEEL